VHPAADRGRHYGQPDRRGGHPVRGVPEPHGSAGRGHDLDLPRLARAGLHRRGGRTRPLAVRARRRPRDPRRVRAAGAALPHGAGMTTSATPAPTVAPTITPTIEVSGVSRWYGNVVAVNDVTFAVQPGITGL